MLSLEHSVPWELQQNQSPQFWPRPHGRLMEKMEGGGVNHLIRNPTRTKGQGLKLDLSNAQHAQHTAQLIDNELCHHRSLLYT